MGHRRYHRRGSDLHLSKLVGLQDPLSELGLSGITVWESEVLLLGSNEVDTSSSGVSLVLRSSLLDLLLGIVPSTTSVRGRDGNLNTRDDGSSEESSNGVWTEEESGSEWGSKNEDTWGDHSLEGSIS